MVPRNRARNVPTQLVPPYTVLPLIGTQKETLQEVQTKDNVSSPPTSKQVSQNHHAYLRHTQMCQLHAMVQAQQKLQIQSYTKQVEIPMGMANFQQYHYTPTKFAESVLEAWNGEFQGIKTNKTSFLPMFSPNIRSEKINTEGQKLKKIDYNIGNKCNNNTQQTQLLMTYQKTNRDISPPQFMAHQANKRNDYQQYPTLHTRSLIAVNSQKTHQRKLEGIPAYCQRQIYKPALGTVSYQQQLRYFAEQVKKSAKIEALLQQQRYQSNTEPTNSFNYAYLQQHFRSPTNTSQYNTITQEQRDLLMSISTSQQPYQPSIPKKMHTKELFRPYALCDNHYGSTKKRKRDEAEPGVQQSGNSPKIFALGTVSNNVVPYWSAIPHPPMNFRIFDKEFYTRVLYQQLCAFRTVQQPILQAV